MNTFETALFERLDRVIFLLEKAVKQPALSVRIFNGVATGVGILSAITILDVVKSWLGG